MCGIAGIVAVDQLEQDAPARALRMRDIITHRGPDEAGLHCMRTPLWPTAASASST